MFALSCRVREAHMSNSSMSNLFSKTQPRLPNSGKPATFVIAVGVVLLRSILRLFGEVATRHQHQHDDRNRSDGFRPGNPDGLP